GLLCIGRGSTVRPGLKNFERPHILLGHVANSVLKHRVHGGGIRYPIVGRKVRERRIQNDLVTATAGKQTRKTRYDVRARALSDTPESGQRCRGHTEERSKYR